MSFYAKYNHLLKTKPLVTNMVTTGFLFGTGDCLAQQFFTKDKKFDYTRTIRAVAYGAIIFAPVADKWYKFINAVKLPKQITTSSKANTLYRVALDQLGFAPFIGIPLYYSVMTVFEMSPNPIQDIKKKIHDNLWDTLTTNWLVWPLFQLVNFSLVPVQLRLLSVNVVSIGWNCYLSYILNDKKDHMIEVKEEEIMM